MRAPPGLYSNPKRQKGQCLPIFRYKSRILVSFAIPLSLSQWSVTPIKGDKLSVTETSPAVWKMESDQSAGGWVYVPAEEIQKRMSESDAIFRWKWKVNRFPKTDPHPPFQKTQDDFAIRVGFLLSGERPSITLMGKLRELAKEKSLEVTGIQFYSPQTDSPKDKSTQKICDRSPYEPNIRYCLMSYEPEKWQPVQVTPLRDYPNANGQKIVGIWIVTDSDNSSSQSSAELKEFVLGSK